MPLRVHNASTHRTAQSRVLVLGTGLAHEACVVPLNAGSRPTLNTHSAVLKKKDMLENVNESQRTVA